MAEQFFPSPSPPHLTFHPLPAPGQVAALEAEIATKDAKISNQNTEIAALNAKVASLMSMAAADFLIKTKHVFAHYMVCNRSYGGSVAGYERDIRDAQGMGLDGFALNCGGWGGANYKFDTGNIFQAAANIYAEDPSRPRFLLFFSADMSGLQYAEIVEMMTAYAAHPNYYRKPVANSTGGVDLRPYLSTWGGEGGDYNGPTTASVKFRWNSLVLSPLKALGINCFFVPRFFIGYTQADIDTLLTGFTDGSFILRGYTNLPDAGGATTIADWEAQIARVKAAGMYTMSSVSPQYWGSIQTSFGRAYFEYQGGLGRHLQWMSIINVQQPDDVELFTWNDFTEFTYWSPIDDVDKYWPYLQINGTGFFKQRHSLKAETPFYIQWFKTGVMPAISDDTLIADHRIMPNATNLADPEGIVYSGKVGPATNAPDALDEVFVTTLFAAAATLVYKDGNGATHTTPVDGGVQHTAFPFVPGTHSVAAERNGMTFLTLNLEPVVTTVTPPMYNFCYSSRAATASYAG